MVDYAEPDFLPWDGRRVPMTFLAGYLGAGKTTLLNQMLARTDRPMAVLVNDVGEINIDAAQVRRRHGDTIELTDGCVCCGLSEGFAAAITSLRERPVPPDHVVVELSGVADPTRVVPWSRSAGFTLDGVVTLVDAESMTKRLADPLTAGTVGTQIDAADLVVVTKLDLVDADRRAQVEDLLAERRPDVPVIGNDGDVAAVVVGLGGRRPEGATTLPTPTLFDHHETALVVLPDPVDDPTLDGILDDLPATTVRAKGIARHRDGRLLIVQVVGNRRSITELPTPEREAPTDLVVITLPDA